MPLRGFRIKHLPARRPARRQPGRIDAAPGARRRPMPAAAFNESLAPPARVSFMLT